VNSRKGGYGFGTFAGVFTPCLLTIFGVIMFLRAGYVVGNAGLLRALAILAIAKSISLLTTLSLSAVATNQQVKGGGAYFLISRSLGTEFGGSIGIALYLAQAVSVSLYVIGFTEAFCSTFTAFAPHATAVAVLVCLVMFAVTYVGAGWAIKVQFLVLAALVTSILSFFAGGCMTTTGVGFTERLTVNLHADYLPDRSFWVIFAIYFPAVTGIMAGASMSGDLADPQKSLPTGTLAAVVISAVVYAAQMVLMAGCCARGDLLNDTMVLKRLSLWGPLVDVGIWAATLSSALGSFVGAPRVLQALARDRIFPSLQPFAAGAGPTDEPRRAVVLTLVIALAAIMAGDLNVIAPVITMFFLSTYGMVIFACFYESRALNPSFRPRFTWFHWTTALAGALGCLFVMFLVNRSAAVVSLLILFGLYRYLEEREVVAGFGDAKSGYVFRRAVTDLAELERLGYHPKNWRPQILVLSGNPKTRPRLVELADMLECGRGFLVVANVLAGPFEQLLPRRATQEASIRTFLRDQSIEGFPEVVIAESFEAGFLGLAQSAGVGRLKPNAVLMGWCENDETRVSYARCLRRALELGLDVLIHRHDEQPIEDPARIDVWWRGRENGNLMVIFAYLLTQNEAWRKARIRVLRIIGSDRGADEARQHLEELLREARVDGEAQVVVSTDSPRAVIAQWSDSADLVFMGVEPPVDGEEAAFMDRCDVMTESMRNVVLVKSTGRSDITA